MNSLYPSPQALTLDKLTVNHKLARRLPSTVAFRYHALPIAKENDHITIAMANPYDNVAREAIATSLGMQPYVVQGNQAAIDKRLAEVWPDEARYTSLNIMTCCQASPIANEVKAYAEYIGDLLGSNLAYFQLDEATTISFDKQIEEASRKQDLVIFGEPDQPLIKQIFSGPAGCRMTELLHSSILVARQPRRPLQKILLITRGYQTDDLAVKWLIRLAQPSDAIATVLALVPPTSAMCQRAATCMPHGVADWLATDTPLGYQLRQVARQLVNWEINGALHFRQGSPGQQIQREIAKVDYDLIVITADPNDWWLRRLLGEIVYPLLHRVDRPVLIAKPTIS